MGAGRGVTWVLVTNWLHKPWEWQEKRRETVMHMGPQVLHDAASKSGRQDRLRRGQAE